MMSKVEFTVKGMDCAGCARTVHQALAAVEGVEKADILLAAERAELTVDRSLFDMESARRAVKDAGYTTEDPEAGQAADDEESANAGVAGATAQAEKMAGDAFRIFGLVFGAILVIAAGGEWLGVFDSLTTWIPFWAGTLIVLVIGWPVLKSVVKAALKKRVTPHALMAVGAIAALLAGEWLTAAIVTFFMRTGDFVEGYTTDKARNAIRTLVRQAPGSAIVIREGREQEVTVDQILKSDRVLVRPGGQIPVDGTVVDGFAAVDQSAITGESAAIDVGIGSQVYAATTIHSGRLLVEVTATGKETTFGKIIRLVEEAEIQKGPIQSFSDRFTAWYLPVVLGVALITWLSGQGVMSVVAVMVVACSCAFALATPVALLASVGSGARRGILVKGGKYLELLSQADVLLIDKTGTLTTGDPEITAILPVGEVKEGELLQLAASVELYSEHPLAKAIQRAADERFLLTSAPESFESFPGLGVKANINGDDIRVQKAGLDDLPENGAVTRQQYVKLSGEGQTVMSVFRNDKFIGLLAAEDHWRDNIGSALDDILRLGVNKIELLTGDNPGTASKLADSLGITFQAELLPADKIRIVKEYQAAGHKVVMIGDGINDAPALAQADVGISINQSGTDVAVDTAHINLLRDDWTLVPELFKISQRTMRVVKGNFAFTALYNIIGLSLAAVGILPPVLAAAAQSIPDIGIMVNSSRLLEKSRDN